jgi:23S rRNA (guanosine2251-2'-O)-methyltransferase
MKDPSSSRQHWLWGRHAVEEALRAGGRHIKELRILHQSEGEHIQEMVHLAREAGAKVRWVSRSELDKLSGSQAHQGLAIMTDQRPTKGLDEFLDGLTEADKKSLVIVALDQIQDPHNFGAIARSAVCLGAKALLVPERRTAPVTQAVVQASAGAIEKIQVYNVGNLAQTLARLKEQGFWIYGADMTGKPAWEVRLNTPLVLVIGSEGTGMRRLIQESCDEVVKIPQDPQGVASLNASCAATVLLYEIARQLKNPV